MFHYSVLESEYTMAAEDSCATGGNLELASASTAKYFYYPRRVVFVYIS